MDTLSDKEQLRARMARLRDAIPPEERRALSQTACRHALELLRGWSGKVSGDGGGDPADKPASMPGTGEADAVGKAVLVYVPFRSEADTWPIIRALWQDGVPVAAPKADKPSGTLALYRIECEQDLKPGAWGIPEPDPEMCPAVGLGEIGAVIVPGLAFDRTGGRLGYGAGFYDRLFGRYREEGRVLPFTIGFAFACQVVSRVPMGPHDVPVDRVVTEEGDF